jgi:hypothetical protein
VAIEIPNDSGGTTYDMKHFMNVEEAHKYIEEQLKINPTNVYEIYLLWQVAKIPSQVKYFNV